MGLQDQGSGVHAEVQKRLRAEGAETKVWNHRYQSAVSSDRPAPAAGTGLWTRGLTTSGRRPRSRIPAPSRPAAPRTLH